jgi:SsrA-binding protein
VGRAKNQIAVRKARDGREYLLVASNRRARHDYEVEQTEEAGIVLTGTEVKALRQGRASLADGWVSFEDREAWLEGVHIPEYAEGTWTNHAPRRKRKLLLHANQIRLLAAKSREKGYTVVPLQLYFSRGRAKVEIALARGKQEWDKRQALRERTDQREAERAMAARDWR